MPRMQASRNATAKARRAAYKPVQGAIHRQPRLEGERRHPVATSLQRAIDRAVEREMARYGVSRSFVLAVAVAYALGVEIDERETYKRQPFRVVRGGRR